ncbi:hypothetical protein A4D02_13715 [Niastella koreensis]|uniref:Redoxin domain protein n=2 Tax=Niastella koreensis TaxID=354356 RepID=G8TQ08_NIAKG|nr:redoxin domain-containing protein [Niastella koreensis]AEW01009.1 Redoxin domain protein [Niastella koreensis GR20-10]OQP42618.1 hypothetical protein A4D02_13715 [Niastella koreensis]
MSTIKNNFKRLLYSLLIICIVGLACREKNEQEVYKTGMEGQPIPSFAIQLLDSASFLKSDQIFDNKNLILFYFSPTCPYCRAQMRDMVSNIERLKDKELCVLSNADLTSIKTFVEYFKLRKLNNVIVGRDTGSVVLSTYRLTGLPFTAYFDNNKQLKKAYLGRMTFNSLLQF